MMEDYWVEVGPVYLDLNGRPVKRMLWSDPYSYDEFVIVGYNPFPFCHCYEDTGERLRILTRKRMRNKKTQKGGDVQVQELMESEAH